MAEAGFFNTATDCIITTLKIIYPTIEGIYLRTNTVFDGEGDRWQLVWQLVAEDSSDGKEFFMVRDPTFEGVIHVALTNVNVLLQERMRRIKMDNG